MFLRVLPLLLCCMFLTGRVTIHLVSQTHGGEGPYIHCLPTVPLWPVSAAFDVLAGNHGNFVVMVPSGKGGCQW